MEKALKQRVTGAIILVILGVIFIPVLLDGAGHHARFAKNIEIPPEPEIELKTWEQLKEIPASANAQLAQTEVKASSAKPVRDPIIDAWALQVGSFGSETNALVMRDQLRAKGYKAYVETQKLDNQDVFKVRIGPDLDKSRLEKLAEKLKRAEKIDSLLVKHP